jgi:hypothetical protein
MAQAMKFTGKVDGKAIDRLTKKLKSLKKPVSRRDAKKMGKSALKEMKSLIKSGISPIRGGGKMPRYRGSYAEQIKKKGHIVVYERKGSRGKRYPKSMRPVNLRLTGAFLKNLQARVVKVASGFGISIGYRKRSEQIKERGHREGANNQAIRPTIPQGDRNEEFALRIQRVVIKGLNALIKKLSKKKR